MATELKRKVVRRCARSHYKGNRLVVILEPGDILGMREAGKRTTYRASLERVFWTLAKWHAAKQAEDKAKAKKLKRALRAQGLLE